MAVNREIWPRKPLGVVADVVSGYAFKSSEFGERGIPVIKIKNVRVGHVDLSEVERVDEKYLSIPDRYHVRGGDILISLTGSHISQPNSVVGRVARHSADLPECLLNQRAGKVIVKDNSKSDLGFLFYALSEQKTVRAIVMKAHGAANQANVSPTQVESVEIPLPPLPVQRRIASILSAYDELIENSQRRIKILETMAHTLYREWFVHFRFPGHENHPRVTSPLGEIPKGWEVKPFSGLANYVNGYAFKPSDWGEEGKPIIKIKELKAGVTAETPRNSGDTIPEKFKVRDGDVLFSWSADLDAYLWMGGEGLLNQHLFNVVPFDGLTRTFCFHALKEAMSRFRALSLGATMHHIKRSALDQVSAVVPPAALRHRLEMAAEPMHRQLIALNKQIQNLRRTRDLLLPRLLSGQIDVEAA